MQARLDLFALHRWRLHSQPRDPDRVVHQSDDNFSDAFAPRRNNIKKSGTPKNIIIHAKYSKTEAMAAPTP